MRFNLWIPVVLCALACDGEGTETDTDALNDTDNPAGLALAGTWTDGLSTHTITDQQWTIDAGVYGISDFQITQFDNDAAFLIAQNASDNSYFADQWSRFEWLTIDDQLYYCQILFDGADEQAALDAGPADASDPSTAGCGAFAWSPLTSQ